MFEIGILPDVLVRFAVATFTTLTGLLAMFAYRGCAVRFPSTCRIGSPVLASSAPLIVRVEGVPETLDSRTIRLYLTSSIRTFSSTVVLK